MNLHIIGILLIAFFLIGMGIIIGEISAESEVKQNNSDLSNKQNSEDESVMEDFTPAKIDPEMAVIALKLIKHDFIHMLSNVENRAIDYAIEKVSEDINEEDDIEMKNIA